VTTRASQQLFDFSFALSRHDRGRPLLMHQRRDAQAAMALVGVLCGRGYRYRFPIFNQPAAIPPNGPPDTLFPTDLSFAHPGDLILVTTRVPCHDERDRPMKQIERAYTTLEQQLLDLLVPNFFEHLSRELVLFGLKHGNHFRPGFESLRGCEFIQKGEDAPIKFARYGNRNQRRRRGDPVRTLFFHLYMPELYKGGPGCLLAFGMTGTMTLAWCHRLASDRSELLLRPGFHVLQCEPGAVPERANDPRFIADWKLEEVLMHDFAPGEHVNWMLRIV